MTVLNRPDRLNAFNDGMHGALAQHLATQPTQGLALTKRALAASAADMLDERPDLERDLQREAGRTPDGAEGVRAFMEKRAPGFTGQPQGGGAQ